MFFLLAQHKKNTVWKRALTHFLRTFAATSIIKNCFMETSHSNKVELRNLQMDDYEQLARSFKRIYADSDVFWTRQQIKKLLTIFPEGQVVIIVDDKIVGCALSIIVDYDMVKGDHTYAKVTGNETFNTHNPNGNILYGIEVFIHPDYRGMRLARRMYEYRKRNST